MSFGGGWGRGHDCLSKPAGRVDGCPHLGGVDLGEEGVAEAVIGDLGGAVRQLYRFGVPRAPATHLRRRRGAAGAAGKGVGWRWKCNRPEHAPEEFQSQKCKVDWVFYVGPGRCCCRAGRAVNAAAIGLWAVSPAWAMGLVIGFAVAGGLKVMPAGTKEKGQTAAAASTPARTWGCLCGPGRTPRTLPQRPAHAATRTQHTARSRGCSARRSATREASSLGRFKCC